MSEREAADSALEAALEKAGARDPREFYRQRLRELKQENPDGYETAVEHFRSTLVPTIASGSAEPLNAWTEYGRLLAELSAPGRTVTIDETGRAEPHQPGTGFGTLILHLPEVQNRKALVVSLPPQLSVAQRATYDWLVTGSRG